MRNTKQKKLVYDIIYSTYDHLDARSIYNKAKLEMPSISLATVYRILNELCNLGKVLRITTDNEDHFDRIDTKHAHFICSKCNKIIDIFDYTLKYKMPDNIVYNYDLVFHGICNDCKRNEVK